MIVEQAHSRQRGKGVTYRHLPDGRRTKDDDKSHAKTLSRWCCNRQEGLLSRASKLAPLREETMQSRSMLKASLVASARLNLTPPAAPGR
jgi:hypothetical protein